MIKFLHKEAFSIKGFTLRWLDVLFFAAVVFLACAIRGSVLSMMGTDYTNCFQPWMDEIRQKGGFASLKYEIGNYTPLYMYLITFLSYFNASPLYLFKGLSIFFDFAGMIAMGLLAWQITKNERKTIFAVAVFALLPTVFLNSAAWAQSDMMNIAFLMFSLYFILRERDLAAGIMFGFAFASKFQAIFFLPFLIIMCVYRKVRWRNLLWAPIIYFVSCLPAALMGRSFKSLFGIYFGQTQQGITLSGNYPNIYYVLGINTDMTFMKMGTFLTIALLGVLAYFVFSKVKEELLTVEMMLLILCVSIGIVLNFLPGMHDRYGLLLDVMLIVLTLVKPKLVWIAMIQEGVSLMGYMPYLFLIEPTNFFLTGLAGLVALAILIKQLYEGVGVRLSE